MNQKKEILLWILTFIVLIIWLITIIYRVGRLGGHINDPYIWFVLVIYNIFWLSNIIYPSKKTLLSALCMIVHYALLNIAIFIGTFYISRDEIILWSINIPLMVCFFWLQDNVMRLVINYLPQSIKKNFLIKQRVIPLYIIFLFALILDGIIVIIFKPSLLNIV